MADAYQFTLDRHAAGAGAPGLETLQRWQKEGKLELHVADKPREVARSVNTGWPGGPPPTPEPKKPGYGRGAQKKASTSIKFEQVAAILFPSRDSHKLSMDQVNDVAHLIRHHGAKYSVFITVNTKDFIDGGRRERLKSAFGIIAMTPEEAVTMLKETEGWK